jgi:4-oxalocrotonate tautomerase
MPLVEIHVIKGVFSPEQKSQMIAKVTDAMVSVEGEKLRGVTWVKLSEVQGGDWAIGGQPLQAADVRKMAAE